MSKEIKRLFLAIVTTSLLVFVGGCSDKEEAEKKEETKQTETSDKNKQNPKNEEKMVTDFVLKNTKVVKIFNVSQRINQKNPDLGPFFVIRGIDERGQKSEVWIKDMKIYEMIASE